MKRITAAFPGIRAFRIYFLIAIPVVLFNLAAIFGPKVLFQDDAANYYNVVNGLFPFWYWKKGLFLCSLSEWISWNIMTFSPQLIRAMYVLFLLVPLSCVIYNLFRKLGFHNNMAYTAAVLPNILPAQNLVPAFLNGSYVLLGLLAMLGCFFKSFTYLDREDQSNPKTLLAALLFLFISTQLMDQAIFFLPVLLFAALGYKRLNRKHLYLALSFLAAVSYKFVWVLLLPRKTAEIIPVTGSLILSRIKYYFFAMLPFPDFPNPAGDVVLLIIIAIIITGLVLTLRDPDNTFIRPKPFLHLSHRRFTLYIYGFLLVWTICNMAAFITMSRLQTVRYSYIAAYGLNALLLISLVAIFKRIFRARAFLIDAAFMILIFQAGLFRTFELKAYYDTLNQNQFHIQKNLSSFNFPMNSQIVIYVVKGENHWGFWCTSSGHLKFILKRKDIDGLIGLKAKHYFTFYDPFNPKSRGYETEDRMNGLSIDRPLFLFVQDNSGFKQYDYALQWKGKTREAPWTIYRVNRSTGAIVPFAAGSGREDYLLKIKELEKSGLQQADILWGGPIKNKYKIPKNGEMTP
ncbi:MAG: hypothetical protein NT166_18915 [Candidatus Aminicenantes bacterium]|nr:hypothetical protein [Candidatus Aminicenantes bacterium]